MTPSRFWITAALFHVLLGAGTWRLARRWRAERCRASAFTWLCPPEVCVLDLRLAVR